MARLKKAIRASRPSIILHAVERNAISFQVLQQVIAEPELRTHDFLDSVGNEPTTRGVRSLLIDHGVLPPRDELLVRFEQWLHQAAGRIPSVSERKTVIQYARWTHLRQLRKNEGPTRASQISWRRQQIDTIIDLLAWAQRRGKTLATLTQDDFDQWGPRRRPSIRMFLRYTARSGLTAKLIAPPRGSGERNPLSDSDEQRWAILGDIVQNSDIDAHTKLAAGLMLAYAVRAAAMVRLRPSDVTVVNEIVYVKLGEEPLALPAEWSSSAVRSRDNRSVPRLLTDGRDDEWLFPGSRAGQHLGADALNQRLKRYGVSPRRNRGGALISLTQVLNPAVIARLTGLDITSCVKWRSIVGSSDLHYAAEASKTVTISTPRHTLPAKS